MVEKKKNERMAAPSCGRRCRLAALLIFIGVLFTVLNYLKVSSWQATPADLGSQIGAAAAEVGRDVGQAAAEVGQDVGEAAGELGRSVGTFFGDFGRSVGELFAPPAPASAPTWLWPLALVVVGLFLIFRRPRARTKMKNDVHASDEGDL